MSASVHQSLLRQPYFLDVPRAFLVIEALAALTFCLLFGAGLRSLLILALILVPTHLVAAHLSRDDHEALPLLLDALGYRRFYPAQGALAPIKSHIPRSSLPRL